MICQPGYAKDLLRKYLEGIASPPEMAELRAIWDIYDDEELVAMTGVILAGMQPAVAGEELDTWEPPVEQISRRLRKVRVLKIRELIVAFFKRMTTLLIVIVAIIALTRIRHKNSMLLCGGLAEDNETPAGIYPCKLAISNNEVMWIDSSYRGIVAVQGNTTLLRTDRGVLEYKTHSSTGNVSDSLQYNTITTTKGQYNLILPDGSKVRLNAGSSIRFPVAFLRDKRIVEIEGEALLEVVPDNDAPFFTLIKNVKHTAIKVTGSGFNIKTYAHGAYTTVIQGSLEIKSNTGSVVLQKGGTAFIRANRQKPGSMDSSIIVLNKVDTAAAVSWRKVMHVYNNTPMKEFVTDMGRMYNLEIVNLDCVSHGAISARICYTTPVEEILKIFRETGLRYVLEGGRIIFCKPDNISRPM